MLTSVTNGWTIHWKALEEDFLMVPLLVVLFRGKLHFLNFSRKTSVFKGFSHVSLELSIY
jgi:hypothetical protein